MVSIQKSELKSEKCFLREVEEKERTVRLSFREVCQGELWGAVAFGVCSFFFRENASPDVDFTI